MSFKKIKGCFDEVCDVFFWYFNEIAVPYIIIPSAVVVCILAGLSVCMFIEEVTPYTVANRITSIDKNISKCIKILEEEREDV